jgi:hypothetical protein
MGVRVPDVDLVPEVTVVVHPWQGQWRWAVQVGGVPPGDLEHCAGSGILPDEPTASYHGEQAGSTAVKALRALGVPARYGYLRLGYDPLPADAGDRPLGVWRGEDA